MHKAIAFLVSLTLLQGCAVALIGAGMGAAKAGNARKKEAQVAELDSYGKYRIGMEQINLEREKAKLQPREIMTFEQWSGHEQEESPYSERPKSKDGSWTPDYLVK